MEKLKALFLKYKQVILYLVFGVLTTLVNLIVFWLCRNLLSVELLVSNVIAWILAVTFAFVTNKLLVFESKEKEAKTLLWELLSFFGGRLFTLGAETLILWLGVDQLHAHEMLVKVIANVVVIVLNFFISKLLVFRRKRTQASE